MKVQDVSNLDTVFGGSVMSLLPAYSDIPNGFGMYSRTNGSE